MKCYACGKEGTQQAVPAQDFYNFDCRTCGKYKITRTASVNHSKDRANPMLSGWLRSQHETGVVPEIDSTTIEHIAKAFHVPSVAEKQQLLLQHVARKSKFPGDAVRISLMDDWSIIWGAGFEEIDYHLKSLVARHLVRSIAGSGAMDVVLEPDGWSRVDTTNNEFVFQDRAFIAMSFDPAMSDVKDALELGIRNAGYNPHRVDTVPHVQQIDQKIVGDIRSSRFVVADFTMQKAGVYFEAGYALAIGKPVIWTVKKAELEKVHFDTRQFCHIDWETPAELAIRLEHVICGVLGRRGPRSI